jgi:hypothetical protein
VTETFRCLRVDGIVLPAETKTYPDRQTLEELVPLVAVKTCPDRQTLEGLVPLVELETCPSHLLVEIVLLPAEIGICQGLLHPLEGIVLPVEIETCLFHPVVKTTLLVNEIGTCQGLLIPLEGIALRAEKGTFQALRVDGNVLHLGGMVGLRHRVKADSDDDIYTSDDQRKTDSRQARRSVNQNGAQK